MAWVPDAQAVFVHSSGPLKFQCSAILLAAMCPIKFGMKSGPKALPPFLSAAPLRASVHPCNASPTHTFTPIRSPAPSDETDIPASASASAAAARAN